MKRLLVLLSVVINSSEAGLWKEFNELSDKIWVNINEEVPDKINPLSLVYTNSCISDLGCFYTGPPFFHPVQRPISLSPSKRIDEIQFLLFTPDSSTEAYYLKPGNGSVHESGFDSSLKTAVLIHGFLISMDREDVRYRMKDAILGQGGYNVIIVDWTRLNGPPYSQAVANTRVVGALIAKLIHLLMDFNGVQAESFYIIGHSLGGEAAGYAGERIRILGRITGLDPAGPWFRFTPPEVRLDPTDAQFVDVIHTGRAEFVLTGFGTSPPTGHMDFYPNGGSHQTGCTCSSKWDNVVGTVINDTARYLNPGCDHSRANQLFLESIDDFSCKFLAVHCANYTNFQAGLCPSQGEAANAVAAMGFHNKMIQGIREPAKFYLRTNGQSPFCKEDRIENAAPNKKV